ncbi:hypothetical protein [Flavobacterium caseinilyticum]|uniref:Uncharacterized protein n=1 Tax=Flavobacterium caseinilyticum TaxID=2541732 RepID=A0A4R5B1G0_9FLAO|nr:hypothetical protein [Flavobacterium caseinilyticum]TDD78449.1 hypothetical protein E0F89_02100 [Flavobacterium caseinilyticum]
MAIKRNNVSDNLSFENLVIQEEINTNPSAYILKYISNNIILSEGQLLNFEGKIQMNRLEKAPKFNNNKPQNRTTESECFVYVEQLWCSEPYQGSTQHHLPGASCKVSTLYIRTVQVLTPDACGSTGGGGTSGSTGSDGGFGDPYGTGGGGGYDNSDYPTEDTYTENYQQYITVPILSAENSFDIKNTLIFYNILSFQQQQWAIDNPNSYNQIIQYQIEQKWSVFSRENSIWAIDVFQEYPEKTIDDVKDLVYRVIVDPSFKNNPCLNGVYQKLGQAPTFDNYLKEYDTDFSVVDLKLSVGVESKYPLASAVTYEPINSLIEIKFNPNYLNTPPLNIARTFIHEMIHAETYRKLLILSGKGEIPWSSDFIESIKNDEEKIAHYYMMYKYEIPLGGSPSEPQHEYMAQLSRNIITEVMKQYDSSQSEDVYNALAWIGLMGGGEPDETTGLPPQPTAAWVATPQAERVRILEIYRNFIKNNIKCQ